MVACSVGDLGEVVGTEAEATGVIGVDPERVERRAACLQLLDVLERGVQHVLGAPGDELALVDGFGLQAGEQLVPALQRRDQAVGHALDRGTKPQLRDRRAGGDVGEHRNAVAVAELLDAHADAREAAVVDERERIGERGVERDRLSDGGEELGQEAPLLALFRVGLA